MAILIYLWVTHVQPITVKFPLLEYKIQARKRSCLLVTCSAVLLNYHQDKKYRLRYAAWPNNRVTKLLSSLLCVNQHLKAFTLATALCSCKQWTWVLQISVQVVIAYSFCFLNNAPLVFILIVYLIIVNIVLFQRVYFSSSKSLEKPYFTFPHMIELVVRLPNCSISSRSLVLRKLVSIDHGHVWSSSDLYTRLFPLGASTLPSVVICFNPSVYLCC